MTDRLTRPTYDPDSIGVQHDGDNRVLISVCTDVLTGEGMVLRLEPAAALDLLADLANQTRYSATRAAQDIQIGDCETCRNTRLVDVPAPGGRVSNDRCPDCGPAYYAALETPYARPRIGGGIA